LSFQKVLKKIQLKKKLYDAELKYFQLEDYFKKDLKGQKGGFLKGCKILNGKEQNQLKKMDWKRFKAWKTLEINL